jgi:hypothetical protein
MSIDSVQVSIRRNPRPGKIKAYADVSLLLPGGTIRLHGFSIVQVDGRPPFVGLPSRVGNTPGKYFPIVELEGAPKEAITTAILEAFERS